MTGLNEQPVLFPCGTDTLLGMFHHPSVLRSGVGVVLVVGGPQYRVGSHRQFVLLARDLASRGIPVFRFDSRGMGDSTGEMRDFEQIQDDIRAAVDLFSKQRPEIHEFVLWGLCDAATANAFFTRSDKRIAGQVLLNPWVRTGQYKAQALLKHYYLGRVFSATFWRSLLSKDYAFSASVRDFFSNLRRGFGSQFISRESADETAQLPERLAAAQLRFTGKSLLIVSGQDLTAKEYLLSMRAVPGWQQWIDGPAVTFHELPAADHTFSTAVWRNQVSEWTSKWIIDSFGGSASSE